MPENWTRMDTPLGQNLPLGMGSPSRVELEYDAALKSLESYALHDTMEAIEQSQLTHLTEEAGAFYEYDGQEAFVRAREELRREGYGDVYDDAPSTAVWVFSPGRHTQVIRTHNDPVEIDAGTLYGYPCLLTHALGDDRAILVDVEALASTRPRDRPVTDYVPQERHTVNIPRPWVVKDPNGVAVVEF